MPLPALKPYWQTTDRRTLRFYHGDALAVARRLPTGSVHCMVTSPPYWGLRDYGTGSWEGGDSTCDHKAPLGGGTVKGTSLVGTGNREGYSADGQYRSNCKKCGARRIDQQLGSEPTVQEYVDKLVAIFRELRRVLRDDGTLWLNLGDTYATKPQGRSEEYLGRTGGNEGLHARYARTHERVGDGGLPPGNLVGVPWRVAFALQEDGWVLRQDIIYAKPSPMPESVTNRCTKAHEYIFLLTKGRDYFYDAEAIKEESLGTANRGTFRGGGVYTNNRSYNNSGDDGPVSTDKGVPKEISQNRNKRSVWTVSHGGGYQGAHFATYPPALIEPCILAGTSEHGCCPRCGASWERVVGKARTTTRPGKDSKVYKIGMHDLRGGRHQNKGSLKPPVKVSNRLDGDITGNRDPERHVTDTRTLGWYPGCKCYGLPPLPKEPKPTIFKDDSHTHHKTPPGGSTPKPHKGFGGSKHERVPAPDDGSSPEYKVWISEVVKLCAAANKVWDPNDDGEGEGAVPCVVLDPFLGSGTTALVCLDKGRACWGIDLSKEYLDRHAVERCRGNLLSRPLLANLASPRPQGVPAP
jgi:DNA modification methylase